MVASTMWKKLEVHRRPRMKNDPVLLVSVSTTLPQYRALYSQARELANYMIRKMKFTKVASLYSSALPPAVVVRDDGISRLVSDHFYHHAGERDIILLAGDGSPVDEQYEFAKEILGFASRLGAREVFSVGARWTEQLISPLETPKVLGFSTDAVGVEELRKNGVEIARDEPAPFFANLVVGLAGLEGMRGFKVSVNHGEPVPHPKSLIQFLDVLSRMMRFQVERDELEEAARRLPSSIQSATPPHEGRPAGQNIYH